MCAQRLSQCLQLIGVENEQSSSSKFKKVVQSLSLAKS